MKGNEGLDTRHVVLYTLSVMVQYDIEMTLKVRMDEYVIKPFTTTIGRS